MKRHFSGDGFPDRRRRDRVKEESSLLRDPDVNVMKNETCPTPYLPSILSGCEGVFTAL